MGHEYRVFAHFPHAVATAETVEIELRPEDLHHLKNVLRLTTGSSITIADSAQQRELTGKILGIGSDQLSIEIVRVCDSSGARSRVLSLSYALTKGKSPELVCEKATELGVHNLNFFQSERSVVRIREEGDRRKKEERLAKIAEAAAKQSGRAEVPQVNVYSSLTALLTELSNYRKTQAFLLASLSPQAAKLNKINPNPTLAHLLIGPEGDLSPGEEEALVNFGFKLLTLGPLRLRSETAAIAAVATVNAEWGFSN